MLSLKINELQKYNSTQLCELFNILYKNLHIKLSNYKIIYAEIETYFKISLEYNKKCKSTLIRYLYPFATKEYILKLNKEKKNIFNGNINIFTFFKKIKKNTNTWSNIYKLWFQKISNKDKEYTYTLILNLFMISHIYGVKENLCKC